MREARAKIAQEQQAVDTAERLGKAQGLSKAPEAGSPAEKIMGGG